MHLNRLLTPALSHIVKRRASCGGGSNIKGLILGCYNGCSPGEFKLTKAADEFDKSVVGKLSELLKGSGVPLGEAMLFTNVSEDFYSVAVGGLGEEGAGYDPMERLNFCKENIRIASGLAARKLKDTGMGAIYLESFGSVEPAVEGAALSIWQYQDLKSSEKKLPNPALEPYKTIDPDAWLRGSAKAEAQNLARYVEEVPSNLMTPSAFAEHCIEALCSCGAQVEVHDKDWIETQKMSCLLTVGNSSCEDPLFLELKYCGGELGGSPIVLAGKAITHDTGGLCLKQKDIMSEYRADMAGAGVILGAIRCAARMALPINIIGLIPICENMIGGLATKPGDVIHTSNGVTVRLADPDNEGRVVLVDALLFSVIHKPCLLGSIGTFTPGMKKTLGSGATGIFTTSEEVWGQMDLAGSETGDRVWRFPTFWDIYRRKITDYIGVDVSNVGLQPGNAGQAAAFLKEFVKDVDYFHADITGTGMLSTGVGHPYLKEGVMTGRPTRTIAQFIYQVACPHEPAHC